jgi:2-aminoadipate transaminase
MPPGVSWSEPSGGFFTWLTLPDGRDASELRPAALEAGVNYVPGRPFYPGDEGAAELRVSFSYLSEAELATAVERLAGVIAA